MNDDLQVALLIAAVIAGLSGWAAIFAWWFRERSKTVRGIKELRRTNTRLQKTVMFALDKWRDQVVNNCSFLQLERAYAEELSKAWGVSTQDVKNEIRKAGDSNSEHREADCSDSSITSETRRQLAAIMEVERYARTGDDKIAGFGIDDGFRKAA